MNIKGKFLSLTNWTYPHGSEEWLENSLPYGTKRDEYGNYFLKIGESKTLFTSHLDTASQDFSRINHKFDGDFIKSDGTTILGADDKAGVCIMLYMIENKVPGTYYFFVGEEVGCIGSRKASTNDEFSGFDRCISFDRRGYNSIITHQMWSRCCSKEFATSLCEELNKSGMNYTPDDTGMATDSASFMGIIPECTNVSVGYFNEHTFKEKQNIKFLEKLCKSLLLVNWESLPVYEFDEYELEEGDSIAPITSGEDWFSDKLEVHIGNKVYLAKLKMDRIVKERSWIYEWIFTTQSYYDIKSVDWDGKTCYVNYGNYREFIGNRKDLIYIIEDLSEIPINELVLLHKL